MNRLRATAVAAVLGVLSAVGSPPPVHAALLWSLTASPLAVTTGTPTTFTLTAANLLLDRIECVIVDVPANFSVGAVGVLGSTAGDSWVAARTGNRVTVWTTSGGDRLELLDNVRFTIAATAMAAGSLAWAASAYDRQDCRNPGSVLGVPPVVVVTGPAITPTPLPTPLPTPVPTPVPTLVPTPVPTLVPTPTPVVPLPSIPLPSILLPTTAAPDPPQPTPRPDPTATGGVAQPSPRPVASETASPTPDGSTSPPRSGGGDDGGPQAENEPLAELAQAPAIDRPPSAPRVAFDEPTLDLDIASVGLLGGATIWAVPVATIGGPGLIVLLWVALQAGGVSLWIPAVRRLRGEEHRPAP
jgi:hypothetical protein